MVLDGDGLFCILCRQLMQNLGMSCFSISKDFANVPVMWKPTGETNLSIINFWKFINQKYDQNIKNYWDLHKWTIENVVEFWAEMWDYSELIYSKIYDEVIDLSVSMADAPKWFKGAKLNFAENLLKYRDDCFAIISAGEEKETKTFTYAQLYAEACRYGAALKTLGLKKDDVVVGFMPNREEAYFAMLGSTAAGATWSGASPLNGAKAVIRKFLQVNPKFLFTVDRFLYEGEEFEVLTKLKEITESMPSLEKVIIIPSKAESLKKDISDIRNSCFLEEFLACGLEADGTVPELQFEQLPFNHPVYITYTSGTTGDPKALVHGVGCLLNTMRGFWLQSNATRGSVFLCTSPIDRATWNEFSTMLFCGLSLVVYEGWPFSLSPTYLWDMVDKYKITNLFLMPSCLDDLEKKGYVPSEKNHLSSLQTIVSGGSVVKCRNYDFVYTKIKPDVIFGSVCGSTELTGTYLLFDRTLPIHKGEIATPALGADVQCFDDNGKAVEGEMGELVILNPQPVLPLSILHDKDGTIYKKTYFSKFPGVFSPGDVCLVNPVTKGFVVYGRSDDTLKPKGARFGSSEIYNIVHVFPEIRDSLCVAQYNELGDERAVLFLKMQHGHLFTQDLVWHVQKTIERELSKIFVPEVILEVKDIPYNMNGKKMEIIVKKIINKMPYKSETVINEECLALYEDIPELRDYK